MAFFMYLTSIHFNYIYRKPVNPMLRLPVIQLLCYLLLLTACDPNAVQPQSSFDAPFPKANKQLSNILGETVSVKSGDDTITLHISGDRKYNLITGENGDTLFYGQVSKFRELYFLSEKHNDTTYHIYAIKISRNYIYGLTNLYSQPFVLSTAILDGAHQSMVKYVSPDSTIIRLTPDKKELRKLFAAYFKNSTPDTIIPHTNKAPAYLTASKEEALTSPVDPEEYSLIKKIYPNPVKARLTIETEQAGDYTYEIINMSGNTLKTGHFKASNIQVDVADLVGGIYLLRLYNHDESLVDVTRIVKHD